MRGDDVIPELTPGCDPVSLDLSPAEGFLLSRIDGHTSWAMLRQIGGIDPAVVEQCLARWVEQGILAVPGGVPTAKAAIDGPPKDEPGPGADEGDGATLDLDAWVDPGLDLTEDLQREILAYEASLERSYFDLLGIERSADARAVKRAYFGLSKKYHPDRYFRKNIGGFAERLDRIFKKLAEAYELLSDPATRAEIERTLEQMPQVAPTPTPASASAAGESASDSGSSRSRGPSSAERDRQRKREMLGRLRKRFQIPERIMAERRLKAREFHEASKVAIHRERWSDAATSMRLAIAFDPWNPDYKGRFAEVLSQYHLSRASALLEEASFVDANAQHEAMRLLEEALSYRPADPQLNERAARLALEMDDIAAAREYAEMACDVSPDVAANHATLAKVYVELGLMERATRSVDEALRLDPNLVDAKKLAGTVRSRKKR